MRERFGEGFERKTEIWTDFMIFKVRKLNFLFFSNFQIQKLIFLMFMQIFKIFKQFSFKKLVFNPIFSQISLSKPIKVSSPPKILGFQQIFPHFRHLRVSQKHSSKNTWVHTRSRCSSAWENTKEVNLKNEMRSQSYWAT